MSPLMVGLVIAAIVVIVVGVQLTARQMQHYPVNSRGAGSLIDTTRERTLRVTPVELETMRSVVTESLSSQAVAASKLEPLLDELLDNAPGTSNADAAERRTGRRARSRQLDVVLTSLEEAWRVDGPVA